MPITDTGAMGGFGALKLNGPNSFSPNFSFPSVGASPIDPKMLQTDPSQVYSLLSQTPQSLTATLGPLLQQVFGSQNNLMAPLFGQMGAQGASVAQSDAMKRGLTGSSIEESGIQSAYTGANQQFSQYLAQQLGQIVPMYSNAAQFDIGNQQQYYSNLAQAVGQQLSNQMQFSEFQNQLNAGMSQASMLANSQKQSGMWGGVGSLLGGLAGGIGAAGGVGSFFSDIRLKELVQPFGKWKGMTWYLFGYVKHPEIDLPRGLRVGLMAHEVARSRPDCVTVDRGYLKVDYLKLLAYA